MKLLIFPFQLVMSGTVVNAIDLATALRDLHGFEVVLFATPGPLSRLVEEKGLRLIAAPAASFHPTPARMRALRAAVRQESPDLLQVWDWAQCIDAYYAVHLLMRVPMVVTDMSMCLPRMLPKGLATTFGTPDLVDQAIAHGHRRAECMLPPVDATLNSPGAVDQVLFRQQYGIAEGDITLVTVSRMDQYMKGESLLRTLEVVHNLGRELPLRLILVGDGTAREQLESLAKEINLGLKRRAVVLTGALLDPRPAYAAADIVIGMGGSALRGMAFGKAVIVVGQQGFSEVLTPDTADYFLRKGMYGTGDGDRSNCRLATSIRRLAASPEKTRSIGNFSRQFVLQHFSIEAVSERFAALCRRTAVETPNLKVAMFDGLRTAAIYMKERRFVCPL